ncbi:DUF2892 domain-containing protein [Maribellus sp. YY47]|uniref:YgaP family membrane protein n=1 Tax=Maribellus sp. YY47 TaxID=2929486 RepID=UPI002001314D|nr:DUF2892 domain-containing protein [Maribellus sp. YY47]MCK3685376.1 DUF2892 domain-containing protein [Maribellus sp. YY47]
MKSNVGAIDRLIRIIFGMILAIAGIIFDSWWGLIGIIPLATGLLKFCPLYVPFKLSTTEKDS